MFLYRFYVNFKKILIISILILFSCNNNNVELSKINISISFKRFEKDLFKISPENFKDSVFYLKNKYPVFYKLFVENIIRVGKSNEISTVYFLKDFVEDPYIRELYEKTDKLYDEKNFKIVKEDLTNAFKYYHYYFPKRTIPNIYTFISGFNYAVVVSDSLLGVGLDMFLGKPYTYYKKLNFPKYKYKYMSKKYLTIDMMRAWFLTEFPDSASKGNLLDKMIYYGKILYLLDLCFPNISDDVKIKYSKEEIEWCKSNEKEIWFHLVDNDLLYTQKKSKIVKYIKDAPFTPGFPKGSPGRVGRWVGWQIVKQYMQNNKDITVKKLMFNFNATEILNKSHYKPL